MRPTYETRIAPVSDPSALASGDSAAAREIVRRFHRLPEERVALLRQCATVAVGAGCDLYWVGGGVRDLWLGTSELDVDLLVDGEIATFAAQLAAAFGSDLRSHPEFLTAELQAPGGFRVDLAQVRTERYAAPAALPQVAPGTLASDFARRDFTINCLAIPLAPTFGDRLLDSCGGVADLERRRLRVLHPASFRDDPTRILRGLEFEARFDFELEAETRRQIERTIAEGTVALLSPARLREALSRALARGRTVVASCAGCGSSRCCRRSIPAWSGPRARRRRWKMRSRPSSAPRAGVSHPSSVFPCSVSRTTSRSATVGD
jgi:hypothetical protein